MKNIILALVFLLSFFVAQAQETYTVGEETLELKTEVEGNLDLLWNVINGQYRYFVRTKDGTISELKNTKGSNKKFQEEYKATLNSVMDSGYNVSIDNVDLTLPSLKKVIDLYNGTSDVAYQSVVKKAKPQLRLGVLGGITNFPFVENPDNALSPIFGTELEVISNKEKPRHSGFFQLRHALENDELQYSSTELSLGYRYRFVSTSKLGVYANVKFATLSFNKVTYTYENNNSQLVSTSDHETIFDAPFIFGIGGEYRISNRAFISLNYNRLVAIFLDNSDNFSTDVSLGFKMIL
ncbi:outer membrane beta-barrel protein [Mangrovimonas cancribranchiae]|uniref:Outer membrane beta-barrel protein n=1 Tax=Mangrovimonas cancribranchiae TaxID=3080055 RepID=A0AAU6P3S7_9FLAO